MRVAWVGGTDLYLEKQIGDARRQWVHRRIITVGQKNGLFILFCYLISCENLRQNDERIKKKKIHFVGKSYSKSNWDNNPNPGLIRTL
jgi:hypothetical protein